MISIKQFTELFNKRHDFISDDLEVLQNKFKHIVFNKIPEAWICEIDSFISKIKNPELIKSINQVNGFVVVVHDCTDSHDKHLAFSLVKRIEMLDIDLYEQLGEGIILN